MKVSVLVLTMGTRPKELDACLRSALAQHHADLEVVCVGNGWAPEHLPEGVRAHTSPDNLGSVAGRNLAVGLSSGEVFLFLDDDAWIADPELVWRAVALFTARPRLGLLQPRITDADGVTLRRWVPRARVGDPARSGPAFTCAEGVSFFRRQAWDDAGGFPASFFHGHEGIEVVWRLRDRGWDAWYQADLVVHHPALPATRHEYFQRLNARNRVWVARRNLPTPVAAVYIAVWTAVTLLRNRTDLEATKTWLAGWREGWRTSPGERRPMRWRTVLRLARLGQPPVI